MVAGSFYQESNKIVTSVKLNAACDQKLNDSPGTVCQIVDTMNHSSAATELSCCYIESR